jgi:hypothetical protein
VIDGHGCLNEHCIYHKGNIMIEDKIKSVCNGINYILESIGMTASVFYEAHEISIYSDDYHFSYSIEVHTKQYDNYYRGRFTITKSNLLSVPCDELVHKMFFEILMSTYELVGWKYGRNDNTISHNGIDSNSN